MKEVADTSTATVRCKPVGGVSLDSGDAVFANSGYLRCSMDLAQIVWENHNLQIPAVDSYGSVYAANKLMRTANGIAPIFTHRDAKYSIDFSNTQSATLHQALSNQAGPLQANYPGITINAWHIMEMQYICVSNGGLCDANFFTGRMTSLVVDPGNSAH